MPVWLLVSVGEASKLTGVSRHTIYARIRRGHCVAFRVSGHWMLHRHEVMTWMEDVAS